MRKQGIVGALLLSITALLSALPSSPVAAISEFLNLGGVVLLYSAFRDASWIFQNQSIYRNLVIGLAVYYVVAGAGALAALTYYGFTDPNRLPQTVSIALILVS